MPRQCRRRKVQFAPKITSFKPRGVPMRELTEVYLPVECLEALRLADHEGMGMAEAARRMEVSRHTFGRVLAQGRRAVAEALVNGHALRIEGGVYDLAHSQPAELSNHIQISTEEPNMQRIAVTTTAPGLDAPVDPRFGRAAGFALVDPGTMEATYVDNGKSQTLSHGAGIHAAQQVARHGADVLLTGYVGPKAFEALQAANIQIGQDVEGVTVRQAVEKYLAGAVAMSNAPNSPGHQGR